ncbi:MAG: hypothetical protein LC646_11315 [Xanthomonadaceae bacterium]|nr:hypothetical protein [Xanthomonadaceae bacterium]
MLLLVSSATSQAQSLLRPLGFADPQPFRMEDALAGRDIHYNDVSFLHRISFLPITPPSSGLAEDREGLFGSAGSTRSNELYALMHLQKTMPLDNDWFLRYRFQRDEDFDGRYDRNLLGVGRDFGEGWSASFSGDIEGDKSRIDLEAELTWRDGAGSHARLVLVAPDYLFNDKQEEAQFTRQPYTGFADLRWQWTEAIALLAFVNHNTDTSLRNESLDLDFHYRKTAGGVGIDADLGAWQLRAWLEGEQGRRRHESLSASFAPARLSRRHHELGAELGRDLGPDLAGRAGVRVLRFEETGRHGGDPMDEVGLRRDETMLYAGVSWRLGARYRFYPTVYLNFIDNHERFPADPVRNRDDEGFVGKLGLPLEVLVHEASGATLTFNPTLYLHRLAFGGGNLQASIPF